MQIYYPSPHHHHHHHHQFYYNIIISLFIYFCLQFGKNGLLNGHRLPEDLNNTILIRKKEGKKKERA
jgi:hypothetical protein